MTKKIDKFEKELTEFIKDENLERWLDLLFNSPEDSEALDYIFATISAKYPLISEEFKEEYVFSMFYPSMFKKSFFMTQEGTKMENYRYGYYQRLKNKILPYIKKYDKL